MKRSAAWFAVACLVCLPAGAQDSKTWLETQGLEAADRKEFQDIEAIVARAKGAKDAATAQERVVVFAKGKLAWTSNAKENEGAQRFTLHSIGRDLDGSGQAQLHFSTYTGGAHCCTTHYVYRLKPQVKRHAVYPANNVGGGDFLEVPGRKTPIMVSADDSSAYGFAPYANSYFPAVILEVSPKGKFQFATDLMRSKLPGQPPPVCAQPAAVGNPWLKERCGEYASARRNARIEDMKAKLREIKSRRSSVQLKWEDYYETGVLSSMAAELNRYAYTGHAGAGLGWINNMWPGNDAVKLKLLEDLRKAWAKSVFAEDLKTLAADYR